MSRLLALIAALLTLSIGSAHAQLQRRENGWSERGLFVFGSYVIDFWRGYAAPSGSHMVDRIEDCSNTDFYCIRGHFYPIVLPRACGDWEVGEAWRVGDVTTRVVAHVNIPGDPHHLPFTDHVGYALATDGYNAVFLYDAPYGVKSIHPGWPTTTDPARAEQQARSARNLPRVDAREVAIAGGLSAEASGLTALHLLSPDSFGPCRRQN
jgi:hypothetical protein